MILYPTKIPESKYLTEAQGKKLRKLHKNGVKLALRRFIFSYKPKKAPLRKKKTPLCVQGKGGRQ